MILNYKKEKFRPTDIGFWTIISCALVLSFVIGVYTGFIGAYALLYEEICDAGFRNTSNISKCKHNECQAIKGGH